MADVTYIITGLMAATGKSDTELMAQYKAYYVKKQDDGTYTVDSNKDASRFGFATYLIIQAGSERESIAKAKAENKGIWRNDNGRWIVEIPDAKVGDIVTVQKKNGSESKQEVTRIIRKTDSSVFCAVKEVRCSAYGSYSKNEYDYGYEYTGVKGSAVYDNA